MTTPPDEGRIALTGMGFQWETSGNYRWFFRSTPNEFTQKVYWGLSGWIASCNGMYGESFDTPEAAVLDAELNGWWS